MGGRRRCCCGCLYFADDFFRPAGDTTDLGDNWLEVDGDWYISTARLAEAGNASALAIVTREMPPSPGALSDSPWAPYMYVGVNLRNETIGGVYWIVGMWADATHYVKGRYTRVDYDYATIELFSNTGGGETLLDSYTFELTDKDAVDRGIGLCLSDTLTMFFTSDSANCYAMAPTPVIITDGEHSGVGHENTDETIFDNFSMNQLFKVNYQCYPCGECFCDSVTPPVVLPRYLYVLFEGDGDTDCDTLDGIEVTLEYNRCGMAMAIWRGTVDSGCLAGSEMVMELRCDGSWTLTLTEAIGKLACVPTGYWEITPVVQTCDPLYWEYVVAVENAGGGEGDSWCPEPCRPCGNGGGAMEPKLMRYWIYITD